MTASVRASKAPVQRIVWLVPLLMAAAVVLCAVALYYGVHFEPTDEEVRLAAKGQAFGVPAVLGLITSVVALFFQRRRRALWICIASAAGFLCWSTIVLLVT